jgi:hypothetical protein
MNTSTDRQQFREVLAGLAAKTQAKLPALNGRVTKACKLVLAGDVELYQDGTALVHSLTDPTRAYVVTGTPGQCQCKDYDQAPEHLCCHRLAVGFRRKVEELLPTPTPEPPAGPPVAALPEARSSANVRLQVCGHDVQITLRDHDEAALMIRLEELIQRYSQAQAPAPPPVDATPQCPQHGAMQLSRKGKGFYCPQKLADDSWCPSKAR